MHGTRCVTLGATSPAQRANRRARPAVAVIAALAVVVVLALLFLPVGPTLSWILALALAVLAVLVAAAVARRVTGGTKPLDGVSPTLHATAFAGSFLIGSAATRYFTSLLLAPLLGPPEPPTTTLLWSLPTVVFTTAFLVWAARPIRARLGGQT